jgi:CpeT/CpcT family (DUF1001)
MARACTPPAAATEMPRAMSASASTSAFASTPISLIRTALTGHGSTPVASPGGRRVRRALIAKRSRPTYLRPVCCAQKPAVPGYDIPDAVSNTSSNPGAAETDTISDTVDAAEAAADDDNIVDDSPWARGLLTDSVLEVKWKVERQLGHGPNACSCSTLDTNANLITPVADPARFSNFTRIAAPTALFGEPSSDPMDTAISSTVTASESALSVLDHNAFDIVAAEESLPSSSLHVGDNGKHSGNVRNVEQFHLQPLVQPVIDTSIEKIMPYSPVSLAQRMFRYVQSQKHRTEFLAFFQGEFDNYEQIAEQRARGIFPVEGGGHEHIHCSLTVLNDDMLFARYYFNGNPSVVFRSRLYRICVSDASERGIIEMRIFRFYEETERKLKASNYDISAIEWNDDDMYDWLRGCEVFWERYEPLQGDCDVGCRKLGIANGPRFVGYMKGGGCELYSREIDGRIRVMDDLLLTSRDLWVADRGFDETGHFVYGNRRGIPYQMKRVDPDGPAAWTLSTAPAPDGYVS